MMTMTPQWKMKRAMSRTSTTKPNVSMERESILLTEADGAALKEDNPDGAIKAFRTIVDDQTEKGEWWVERSC